MWWYLFYTFLLEVPLFYIFLRKRDNWLNISLVGVLLSAITWPLGMYAYHVWHWHIVIIEFLIAMVESILLQIYWQLGWQRAFLIGFGVNGFSFGVGLLSN
ncbi:MAG: hypothetical protein MUE85_10275 [Microscillaceae bacterium]|jgi:hypothetical protein|nr:hypothetical protein [Microscillaceae bacterium]